MASLYEKIGGKDAVEAAVGVFYEKVMADPVVNHFFTDVDMKRQMGKQRFFLTYAFGGAEHYEGKNMRDAHKHLDLTDEHFQAIANHLTATLKELNVADDLIAEVSTIVDSTYDDVMNK